MLVRALKRINHALNPCIIKTSGCNTALALHVTVYNDNIYKKYGQHTLPNDSETGT